MLEMLLWMALAILQLDLLDTNMPTIFMLLYAYIEHASTALTYTTTGEMSLPTSIVWMPVIWISSFQRAAPSIREIRVSFFKLYNT
jgi:hypothetical protein